MLVFIYDKTFEGLLTAVFDAYNRHTFPDTLIEEGEILPLFCEETHTVITDEAKSSRVWHGLEQKISASALSSLTVCWLSELPGIDLLLFNYIRKAIDAPKSIELNFGDPDVLQLAKIWKQINNERLRVIQFLRFQKTTDEIYFAPVEPIYNVLPLTLEHLKDRYAGQKWLIYDMKREYGYYYDMEEAREVRFEEKERSLLSAILDEKLLDKDELLFQQLWKTYFKSIAIKERINPRLHKQHLPVRFWKYLTEKQP
ncbi:TIGR03915 family putative DNA repair protein [Massilibacteroides sp.]|uniref:TIGR03915 family putative DNA repair protein n=1 Tax=Massilibacteroides sp. TaxID=2034766 RepID=UPI0026134CB3|nr:TIGR03915 family putative DNA repair protein [Massilibacteroides sp.]MDD4514343.1 TIGR03915 family putative DNA repair protein [Massilibacteroides sp.]